MKLFKHLLAALALVTAGLSSASAQTQTTSSAGITLTELRAAILATGSSIVGERDGFLIAQSSFGQQFIATLEYCENAPRCGVVYMGSRVPNRSGQTISSINRRNAGAGFGRYIWLDNGRSDLDSRFLVDRGVSIPNLVLNVALYTVELNSFSQLMLNGVSASLDSRDPRQVNDGNLTLEQVGIRDDAMAAFLNQLPAATTLGLNKESATLTDDEERRAVADEVLNQLEHDQKWASQ